MKTDIPIGKAIRTLRRNLRLTQEQLATRMDCPRIYVSKIECGKNTPLLEQVDRFAQALRVEPWVLVYDACILRQPAQPTRAPEATV